MVYEFYYYETNKSKENIVGAQTCKRPKQTKIWKHLRMCINHGTVYSVGYRPKKLTN